MWIKKYTALMEKYLDKITPQVSDTWRADELFLKVKGNMKYLYALMGDLQFSRLNDETSVEVAKGTIRVPVKVEPSAQMVEGLRQRLHDAADVRIENW
jgi:hypothetical protein